MKDFSIDRIKDIVSQGHVQSGCNRVIQVGLCWMTANNKSKYTAPNISTKIGLGQYCFFYFECGIKETTLRTN